MNKTVFMITFRDDSNEWSHHKVWLRNKKVSILKTLNFRPYLLPWWGLKIFILQVESLLPKISIYYPLKEMKKLSTTNWTYLSLHFSMKKYGSINSIQCKLTIRIPGRRAEHILWMRGWPATRLAGRRGDWPGPTCLTTTLAAPREALRTVICQ